MPRTFTIEEVQRAERLRVVKEIETISRELRRAGYSQSVGGEPGSASVGYGNGQIQAAWRLDEWVKEQLK